MKKKKDHHTVSNEHHELRKVAKKLGVKPSDVLRAKEQTGSRRRAVIEDYIRQHFTGDGLSFDYQQKQDNEQHERNLP